MVIRTLTARNFRRFHAFAIDFHPRLTVVVAGNGQGKTSVLEAAAIALGTFVGAFDGGKAPGINRTDARRVRGENSPVGERQFPVAVGAEVSIACHDAVPGVIQEPREVGADSDTVTVSRELTGPKNSTTNRDARALTEHGRRLMGQVRDLEDVTLPVVSYYSSARAWVSHNAPRRAEVMSASRTMGYEDCLTSASNFKQLQQWLGKATLAVLQQKQERGYEKYQTGGQVDAIKQAVNHALSAEGWDDFHYSLAHEELVMNHGHIGLLPVSLLSDGVRSMVSMVADLAWRCVKLNPHLGLHAASRTPGIVLIDEVDLHLHPAWQQRVVSGLTEIFPRVQFIVTTHSPQVLSTVERDCIRVISFDDDNVRAEKPLAMSYGEESQNVLQAIMGVDPQPPIREKDKLDSLTALVDSGNYQSEEARGLMDELQGILSRDHPQLLRLERSIRRQEALKR